MNNDIFYVGEVHDSGYYQISFQIILIFLTIDFLRRFCRLSKFI